MISTPLAIVMAAGLALTASVPAPTQHDAKAVPVSTDLGRQVLAAGDGWASADGGTTGGGPAAPAHGAPGATAEG